MFLRMSFVAAVNSSRVTLFTSRMASVTFVNSSRRTSVSVPSPFERVANRRDCRRARLVVLAMFLVYVGEERTLSRHGRTCVTFRRGTNDIPCERSETGHRPIVLRIRASHHAAYLAICSENVLGQWKTSACPWWTRLG